MSLGRKASAGLAALATATVAVLVAMAATGPKPPASGSRGFAGSPRPSPAEPPRDLPEMSLYHLGSTWTADDGGALRLADLAGKARLFTLFFGHCEASCPMALGRLKTLEARLPEGWTRHGGLVMVTLDPARDDTGSLAAFRRRMDLGRDAWTLLRGGRRHRAQFGAGPDRCPGRGAPPIRRRGSKRRIHGSGARGAFRSPAVADSGPAAFRLRCQPGMATRLSRESPPAIVWNAHVSER